MDFSLNDVNPQQASVIPGQAAPAGQLPGQVPGQLPADPMGQANPATAAPNPEADNISHYNSIFDKMFAEPKTEPTAPNAVPPAAAPAAVAQPSLQEQQQQVFRKFGLDTFNVPQEVMQQFQEGNFSGLPALMAGVAQTSFMQAMRAQQMMQSKQNQQAITEAKQQAVSEINNANAVSAMETALPYTKDKYYNGIAREVLQKALNAGYSQPMAVDAVGKYFARMGQQAVAAQQNTNITARNTSPFDFLNSPDAGAPDNGQEINWTKLLSGN